MEAVAETPTDRGNVSRKTAAQPLNVIEVQGAQLRLSTLVALSGNSMSTLYRDAKAGRLRLVKRGQRCTRVTAEDARAYLQLIGKGAA